MNTKLVWVLSAGLIVSAFVWQGCCANKIAECNKLITAINNNSTTIKTSTDKLTNSKDAKAGDEFAKAMEKAADNVKELELKDETLKGYAKEYHDMLEKFGQAGKKVSAAGNDQAAMAKAINEVNSSVSQESKIIDKINGYCTGSK